MYISTNIKSVCIDFLKDTFGISCWFDFNCSNSLRSVDSKYGDYEYCDVIIVRNGVCNLSGVLIYYLEPLESYFDTLCLEWLSIDRSLLTVENISGKCFVSELRIDKCSNYDLLMRYMCKYCVNDSYMRKVLSYSYWKRLEMLHKQESDFNIIDD